MWLALAAIMLAAAIGLNVLALAIQFRALIGHRLVIGGPPLGGSAALERRAQPGASGHPAQSPDRRGLAGPAALGPDPLLVQRPCRRPQADQRQVRDGAGPADLPGRLPQAALHRAGGRLLRVEGNQGAEGEAALRDCNERRNAIRSCRHLGELVRMKPSVIVWDLETVPDLAGFAAANDLVLTRPIARSTK
jgi:hypothetical protein